MQRAEKMRLFISSLEKKHIKELEVTTNSIDRKDASACVLDNQSNLVPGVSESASAGSIVMNNVGPEQREISPQSRKTIQTSVSKKPNISPFVVCMSILYVYGAVGYDNMI